LKGENYGQFEKNTGAMLRGARAATRRLSGRGGNFGGCPAGGARPFPRGLYG